MQDYITNCPCCNRQLKITISDSGEITSTVFFDDKNDTQNSDIEKLLVEKGIYFGSKGGE